MTIDKALETLFAMANVQDGYAKKATDPGLKIIHKANARAQREVAAAITDLRAERDAALARVEKLRSETFYIDCEFDGHNGPLLSIAMVREDGWSVHISTDAIAEDPWVIENVLPIMGCHEADNDWRKVKLDEVGTVLRGFIGDCQNPVIIADSPVDIGRFCRAISTGEDGGWASAAYPGMTFIVRNVDCYPTTLDGAVQHNAWWDAMALRAALDEDARHA